MWISRNSGVPPASRRDRLSADSILNPDRKFLHIDYPYKAKYCIDVVPPYRSFVRSCETGRSALQKRVIEKICLRSTQEVPCTR